ncbi:thymic stromal cotransporter homolog isoform X2 [Lates calcarifer]|uniref:Thymic stromal cotransporter homolog isoform X2 n=1 Tax=Lates calcarifer TaxID=8187 RepID=A0AAJ8B9A6_LATCA|nr:thymic stromal cotransporter homolog isoform X2 [Lates calcarifer]
MVLPNLCQTAFTVLRQVEPIIVLEMLGSTLFDTALALVVKDRCANATYPDLSREDSQQKAMTDFFMAYNLIIRLAPIIPALLLAKLSDRGRRKAPIVVPLGGYVLSRLGLLLVVIFRLPVEVMFGAAVLFGLSGGFCAYWPGVMTLASLGSTATDRSKVMMRVELLYGLAGLVGSLVSGHLFLLYTASLGEGIILLIVSLLLHLLCLLHSIFLLQVKHVSDREPEENCHLLSHTPDNTAVVEAPAGINMVNVVMLFMAAILYDFAVGGAIEILGVFVMKEPLSWSATQIGYGNAAGCTIFLTSFLGVILFRRCISDVMLILIGMISFASGIYFMSFVTATYMFYLGTTLTFLQLALKFAGLAYIPAFTKIYQRTLDWFPGFVFTLASIFTVLGMIPISIVGCRSPQRRQKDSERLTHQL